MVLCFHLVWVCIFVWLHTGSTTIQHLQTSHKKHLNQRKALIICDGINYMVKMPVKIMSLSYLICQAWESQGFRENSPKVQKRKISFAVLLQEVKSASMCFLMAGIRDTVWGWSRKITFHPFTSLETRLNLWVCGLVSLLSSAFRITLINNIMAVWRPHPSPCLSTLACPKFTIWFTVALQGGNDYEIYCDPRTIGHEVSSPEETHQLCQELFFSWVPLTSWWNNHQPF